MKNIIGLHIRNSRFPWIRGYVIGQHNESECPKRPDYPEWITVRWDDCPHFPVIIPLEKVEEQP